MSSPTMSLEVRHRSSSSSSSARRPSAARVRVLTVPSGSPRYSAISLCDSPLQYASSTSERSCSGSVSSARWTRHETHSALRGVGRARVARGDVGRVGHRRLGPPAQPVDDRVARDGVEPRRRLGRAPGRTATPTARCSRTCPASRPRRARGRRSAAARCRAPSARSGGGAPRTRGGRLRRSAGAARRRCGSRGAIARMLAARVARASRPGGPTADVLTSTEYASRRPGGFVGAAAAAPRRSRASAERQLERAASNFAPTAFQSTTFHQAAR